MAIDRTFGKKKKIVVCEDAQASLSLRPRIIVDKEDIDMREGDTVVLRRRIATLEKELNAEKESAKTASSELDRLAGEMDALAKKTEEQASIIETYRKNELSAERAMTKNAILVNENERLRDEVELINERSISYSHDLCRRLKISEEQMEIAISKLNDAEDYISELEKELAEADAKMEEFKKEKVRAHQTMPALTDPSKTVTVVRNTMNTLYSDEFANHRYVVKINASGTTMLVTPNAAGKVYCNDNTLSISGLGCIAPFAGATELPAERIEGTGSIRISLRGEN